MRRFDWSADNVGVADLGVVDAKGRRVGMIAFIDLDSTNQHVVWLNCQVTRDGQRYGACNKSVRVSMPDIVFAEIGDGLKMRALVDRARALAEAKADKARIRYLTDRWCVGKFREAP